VGLFEKHLRKYGKSYPHPVEYSRRLAIFKQNWEFIQQYNKLNTGVTLAMNHFGDWSAEEFRQVMLPKSRNKRLGSKKDESTGSAAAAEHNSRLVAAALPSTVDWVAKGAVTPVKDQGACGSCWTFGTTGTVEGAHFIKHGKLLRLSEQQIIDCAWGYEWSGPGGNLGCDGGYAAGALQWLIDNGGIAREEHYPYLMEDAFCLASDIGSGARVTGYVNVTAFSEPALQAAVALNGPVAVAIDAAHPEFTFYSSGVYYNPRCGSSLDALDHEVLAVGYGVYQGQEYWLVKNSWSTHWGMNGYVMMARNRNNNCGIASQANYAIVA
jgi:C1A family cysteine protease